MEGPRAEAWTPARTPPRHVRTCWPSSLPVGQPQPFRVVTGRLALGWPGSSPRPSPCHLRVPVFSWSIVSFVPGVGSVTLGAQRVTLSVPGPRLRSSATPGPRGFAGPPAACAGLSEGAPQGFGVTVRSRASGEQPGRLPSCRSFVSSPLSGERPWLCRASLSRNVDLWRMCLLGQSPSRLEASGEERGTRAQRCGRLLPGTWGWGLWRPLQAAAKMQLLGAWPVPVLGLTGRGLVSRGASSHMRPCRSSQRGAGDQAHGPLSRRPARPFSAPALGLPSPVCKAVVSAWSCRRSLSSRRQRGDRPSGPRVAVLSAH